MGYAVYEDPTVWGRWAGYAVPAECDMPGCTERINRGLGYRCEEYVSYEWDEESEVEREVAEEGCGLSFCTVHLEHETHGDDVVPKPDLPEWSLWLLLDSSWRQWRRDNPAQARYRRRELARHPVATVQLLPKIVHDLDLRAALADAAHRMLCRLGVHDYRPLTEFHGGTAVTTERRVCLRCRKQKA